MKTKKCGTMMASLKTMLNIPVLLLVVTIIVISPVNGSKAPAAAVPKPIDSSHSLPKRQIPNQNQHAQALPYPYRRNYSEQRGENRDTISRHNQNTFQRRADVGSDNKRLSDNNNYNGNRVLDVATGQKRDSQDVYDPFYFYQPQTHTLGQAHNQGYHPQPNQRHHSQPNQVHHPQQALYQRQRGDLSTNTNAQIPNPPRNRRNSHNSNSQNNYFDLNAEKYNILTKSAYPLDNNFDYTNSNSYPSSYRSHYHNAHNAHHRNPPNQFLSQDQLLRQGTNRHVHGSNSLDYYGGAGAYSNRGRGDVPWSVQIGTQLKVNDDGRAPNPTQFYIRDERTGPPHRRHPIYRK